VFLDSKTDVPSGVGLFRTRVTNHAKLIIVTKHRNLRRFAAGNQFTIFIDTRTSHPGPEYAITGGMSDGTDWATGRATRRWHVLSVKVSDDNFTDFGPAKKTFYPWVARG
jgi:hypothetical protein